jgi:hypothetical protein
MKVHACPRLNSVVECTAERESHIIQRHPDLLPEHSEKIGMALSDPDQVLWDADYPGTRLFARWFGDVLGGKNVVVVVASSESPEPRHWVVTAFLSRKPPRGTLEWKRI